MTVEIVTLTDVVAKTASLAVIIGGVPLVEFDYINGFVSAAARPEAVLPYADFLDAFTALRVWVFAVEGAMNPGVTALVAYETQLVYTATPPGQRRLQLTIGIGGGATYGATWRRTGNTLTLHPRPAINMRFSDFQKSFVRAYELLVQRVGEVA